MRSILGSCCGLAVTGVVARLLYQRGAALYAHRRFDEAQEFCYQLVEVLTHDAEASTLMYVYSEWGAAIHPRPHSIWAIVRICHLSKVEAQELLAGVLEGQANSDMALVVRVYEAAFSLSQRLPDRVDVQLRVLDSLVQGLNNAGRSREAKDRLPELRKLHSLYVTFNVVRGVYVADVCAVCSLMEQEGMQPSHLGSRDDPDVVKALHSDGDRGAASAGARATATGRRVPNHNTGGGADDATGVGGGVGGGGSRTRARHDKRGRSPHGAQETSPKRRRGRERVVLVSSSEEEDEEMAAGSRTTADHHVEASPPSQRSMPTTAVAAELQDASALDALSDDIDNDLQVRQRCRACVSCASCAKT